MAKKFNININNVPMLKYNPMFVIDICILPKTGASKLNKFLISNWSNGLEISVYILFTVIQHKKKRLILILRIFRVFFRKKEIK